MDETKLFLRFPESVILRPRMYTMNGTFEEAIAFLQGFYGGCSHHEKDSSSKKWVEFIHWLSDQLSAEYDMDINPVDVFSKIKEVYPVDEIAKVKLNDLLMQFMKEYQLESF